MSKKLLPLVLVAACASAQSEPAVTLPNLSTAVPVAAPNKTLFRAADAARTGGPDDSWHDGKEVRPLVVADSRGEILGPYAGALTVLMTYKKQFMAVPLSGDFATDSSPGSGGLSWTPGSFWYTSSDCSGQPYAFNYPYGARYAGYATLENGKFYIYVIDSLKGTENITYNSYFDGPRGTCILFSGSGWLMPVSDSIPAERLGKPPFFLKYAPQKR